MRRFLPVLLCAAAVAVSSFAYAQEAAATPPAEVKSTPSPTAAMFTDLADEVVKALGNVQTSGVAVTSRPGDTRLERALQEAVITALFEKGIPLLDAPGAEAPTVHIVAFATAAPAPEDHPNLLSRGFSVVRNVIASDPRVSLITKPFSHDSKHPSDATLLVTVSVARQGRLAVRKTNAYILPGSEALAQLALSQP